MNATTNVSKLSSTARTQSAFSSSKQHKLRLNTMSARAQSNKDVWPYWFEPASTSGVPVQSGVDAPPEHLGWALVRSPNPIKELANRKILNRRHFAAAVSVAFFSVSGGAEESKAVIDDNAQRTAKAVAEAQEKQAAEVKRRAQDGADRAKAQQAAAISKTQDQQAKDVAKAKEDQAALKKFLLGLLGFK
mmetsp:Transcript_5225/g.9062  ORF Transcript_5225/g.9062 Transcript_5225/m.9062 type:complete len:190 (-) Transcript_5225:227-796(-)